MITIVKPDQAYSRNNLTVHCPCGRTLRAKIEQAGGEIQCWECHSKVPVPFPRSASDVIQALRRGWDDVFETGLFTMLIGVAAVLAITLTIPKLAVPLGIAELILVTFGYGDLMRRVGDTSTEDPGTAGPLRWLARGAGMTRSRNSRRRSRPIRKPPRRTSFLARCSPRKDNWRARSSNIARR